VRKVILGGDRLALQHVYPLEEADQQRDRIAADLVRAQCEVVDALEQERESLGTAHA
jgi:hypothetical protein